MRFHASLLAVQDAVAGYGSRWFSIVVHVMRFFPSDLRVAVLFTQKGGFGF
jgi:hypothetical protein